MSTQAELEAIEEAALVVSQLFLAAPNPELRAALQDDDALAEWPLADPQSQRGISMLREAVREGNVDSREDLERDHLYLFTGIGKPLAQPFESPYLSKEGLLFEEQTVAVREAYAAHGLRVPNPRVPDDHIGYEFAFVAHLAGQAAEVNVGALPALHGFVGQHLGCFAGEVAEALREHARTAIYRALAELSEGVLAHVRAEH